MQLLKIEPTAHGCVNMAHTHFIKGKISLSPMETILMIPGELKHLESLGKVG
jgi:hypothetical protein